MVTYNELMDFAMKQYPNMATTGSVSNLTFKELSLGNWYKFGYNKLHIELSAIIKEGHDIPYEFTIFIFLNDSMYAQIVMNYYDEFIVSYDASGKGRYNKFQDELKGFDSKDFLPEFIKHIIEEKK